jgi:hypothetical protein
LIRVFRVDTRDARREEMRALERLTALTGEGDQKLTFVGVEVVRCRESNR